MFNIIVTSIPVISTSYFYMKINFLWPRLQRNNYVTSCEDNILSSRKGVQEDSKGRKTCNRSVDMLFIPSDDMI